MRGVYTAVHSIDDLTTADDTVMLLVAASTHVVELLSCSVTSRDSINQQIRIQLHRATDAGASGTALNERPHENGDQAAAAAATGGTFGTEPAVGSIVWDEAQNALAGWFFNPTQAERIYIPPSGRIAMVLKNGVTAFDAVIRITWREIG